MILGNLGTYKAPLKYVHNVWLRFEQRKLTFMHYFCSGCFGRLTLRGMIGLFIVQNSKSSKHFI
jgi:hypothetical protein